MYRVEDSSPDHDGVEYPSVFPRGVSPTSELKTSQRIEFLLWHACESSGTDRSYEFYGSLRELASISEFYPMNFVCIIPPHVFGWYSAYSIFTLN